MADSDDPNTSGDTSNLSDSILELTTRMTEVLNNARTPAITTETSVASIGIKLDGSNYALWSQVVEMYISGKDKLGYINGDFPQSSSTDPSFCKWRTDNTIVKGWLITSMDPSLIGNFIRFPTAREVWDSIATTFFDGSDTSQVYDLKRRVTRLKQAAVSLEKYYMVLQGLWREIDFCRPNPMECSVDIQHYNRIVREDCVYIFLDGLDDRLDNIRADVLQIKPFPMVEQAYAHVRREAIRQQVMNIHDTDGLQGAVLASKALTLSTSAHGKTAKNRNSTDGKKCSHCGNQKHTRETCFKLHGYPDWWHDLQARKCPDGTGTSGSSGTATVASAEPHLSLIQSPAMSTDSPPNFNSGISGLALFTSYRDADCTA
ncbi:hypothetical protein F2P56_024463 [Juglans regia]|uniref:Retrotransposon Copia-like N-terminal domain-containing protein n=2 Tax=Juglans regia TaxID=51240 RepID=A0A833X2R4_JUGRE|nr:uncharacterized protein LOC108993601 [Juglans regia]KAF5454826.1 hypothetical protein F2P56_024463 [Juglans regia]